MIIQPTPGRIVWYHPHVDQGGDIDGQPHPAMIAHVLPGSGLINLTVSNENGSVYARLSVKLLQDGDTAPPEGDYAEWMPFQKGQAAKTDQVAAAVPAIALEPVHAKIDALAADVTQKLAAVTAAPAELHDKVTALEQGVTSKFAELGDWFKATLGDLEKRIAAAAPAAPQPDPAPAPAAPPVGA